MNALSTCAHHDGHAGRRAFLAATLSSALGGCAGVPLSTLLRLRTIRPDDLLRADPSELAVALDVDARVKPASGRAPVIDLALAPVDAGAFAPVTQVLACEPHAAAWRDLGLRSPRMGRHWLVYRLADASARDLATVQAAMRQVREAKKRGQLTVAVRNDWIEELYPVARGTEASTWVRVSHQEGFFELWAGRIPARA